MFPQHRWIAFVRFNSMYIKLSSSLLAPAIPIDPSIAVRENVWMFVQNHNLVTVCLSSVLMILSVPYRLADF